MSDFGVLEKIARASYSSSVENRKYELESYVAGFMKAIANPDLYEKLSQSFRVKPIVNLDDLRKNDRTGL